MENKNQSTLIEKFLYKFYPSKLFKKTTYSQSGEDLLIIKCIEFMQLKKPKYIDLGAHHPFYFNNTALLYEKGFTGINVEPAPALFNYFLKFRQKDINLNLGVGLTNGEAAFYSMSSPTLSTFSKTEAESYVKLGYSVLSESAVKILTLPEIIAKHNSGLFPEILSIDIEGLDHSILESLDLSKNYPKIICAETVRFADKIDFENKDKKLIDLLTGNGYTIFADTFVNTVFFKH